MSYRFLHIVILLIAVLVFVAIVIVVVRSRKHRNEALRRPSRTEQLPNERLSDGVSDEDMSQKEEVIPPSDTENAEERRRALTRLASLLKSHFELLNTTLAHAIRELRR